MTNIIKSVLDSLINKNHHKEGIPEHEPYLQDVEEELLRELKCFDEHERRKKQYKITVKSDTQNFTIITKGNIKMALPITDTQQVTLTVSAFDDSENKNPILLPSGTVWTTTLTDTSIATVTASTDGSQLAVVTTGGLGSFTATATNGAFSATFDITVTADVLGGLVITAGPVTSRLTPVATPAPTPAPVATGS